MALPCTIEELHAVARLMFEERREQFPDEPRYISKAMAALDAAVELIDPTHVFGMMSGGNDSKCASHIASRHPRFSGIIHINTGIGIEQTRQFVRDFCRDRGWKLHEIVAPPCKWAPDIPAYDALVLKFGFPGPGKHGMMYNRLKERALEKLSAQLKRPRGSKILFVSGARKSESSRRMKISTQFSFEKSWAWCSAIYEWDDDDKYDYIARYNLPENEVAKNLCMSGECLCGCFANPGEIDMIAALYPEDAARIFALQDKVRAAGLKSHTWGEAKKTLDALKKAKGGMLCSSCLAAAKIQAKRIS